MPILVGLLVLIGLGYGAVVAFDAIAAHFGQGVAIAVAVVVALLIVAALARWWQRRREVAPNVRDGDWTHRLHGPWGELKFAADKRLCDVTVAGEHGAYIFADINGATPERSGDACSVRMTVKDPKHSQWNIPVAGEREAKRWARIVALAVAQKL
ncbi:hypothetical protein [Paraburkholderia phosphatilytica]|uniref:hypothetical protein n=1 Tax=Paraburkholderia phosphatilytica TaxID=2282883 RepID=UPI000E51301E|nr:hypothetical protein [Paraburkholderia phosphatilytica]